jgi:hypothetical protein
MCDLDVAELAWVKMKCFIRKENVPGDMAITVPL